jgi:hypothetical protein
MSEVTTGTQSSDEPREIRIGARFGIYCAVWLIAALLAAIIPDRDFMSTERFQSVVYAPLVAAFGIALIGTYPAQPTSLPVVMAAVFLVAHAIFALKQSHRQPYAIVIGIQIIVFATAAMYLARFAHLPSGP